MTKFNFMKKLSFIALIAFSLISCDKNEDDQTIIIDPTGFSEYFVKNQIDEDIVVIFKKSQELGLEIDTSDVIEPNTSIKILEDAIIGSNPTPENSFQELNFYNASDLNNPILNISPVQDDDWTIIDQDLGNSGLGSTTYEIIFEN